MYYLCGGGGVAIGPNLRLQVNVCKNELWTSYRGDYSVSWYHTATNYLIESTIKKWINNKIIVEANAAAMFLLFHAYV